MQINPLSYGDRTMAENLADFGNRHTGLNQPGTEIMPITVWGVDYTCLSGKFTA